MVDNKKDTNETTLFLKNHIKRVQTSEEKKTRQETMAGQSFGSAC